MTKRVNLKQKGLALVLAVGMLAAPVASVASKVFEDMPKEGNWARKPLEKAVEKGILFGEGDKIRPNDKTTRAEYTAMINRVKKYEEKADISQFKDVEEKAWFYNDIAKGVKAEIIAGISETEMKPNDEITREQAFAILARVLKLESNEDHLKDFKDGKEASEWSKKSLNGLIEKGIVNGNDDKTLKLKDSISRAEAAVILVALSEMEEEEKPVEEYAELKSNATNIVEAGLSKIAVEVDKDGKITLVTDMNGKLLKELDTSKGLKLAGKDLSLKDVNRIGQKVAEQAAEKEMLEKRIDEIKDILANADEEALENWIEAYEEELAELEARLAEIEKEEAAEKEAKLKAKLDQLREADYIGSKEIKFNDEYLKLSKEIMDLGSSEEYVVLEIKDYIKADKAFEVTIDGKEYKSEEVESDHLAHIGDRLYVVPRDKVEKLSIDLLNIKTVKLNMSEYSYEDSEANVYKTANKDVRLYKAIVESKEGNLVYSFNFTKEK